VLYNDIHRYCQTCDICQQTRSSSQKPAGTLQPLLIPERNWESISIDFIIGLPRTKHGYDMIMTVVDRLSKMTYFVPGSTEDDTPKIAERFFNNITRLHGLPKHIASDRDLKFTGKFWKELTRRCGITLGMTTARHPEADGRSKNSYDDSLPTTKNNGYSIIRSWNSPTLVDRDDTFRSELWIQPGTDPH
jgi:hypothetical protein